MTLTFITGNPGKFTEARATLTGIDLVQKSLHLPEMQEVDPHAVMQAKLLAAKGLVEGAYIVEDSSLTLACLNGKLPGPFIKWFEETIGVTGIHELVQKYDDDRATIRTLIGYCDEHGQEYFFEGDLEGRIVEPRGDKDFGYGPIFLPEGSTITFGEMEREEKHRIGSRAIALRKLHEHLVRA